MENNIFEGVADKTATGTNASAQFGIFLGLLGGTVFLWLIAMHAFQTGVQRLGLLLIIGGMVCQLQGGIEGFRLWGFLAPLWGALAYADSRYVARTAPEKEPIGRRSGLDEFAPATAGRADTLPARVRLRRAVRGRGG